MRVTFLLIAVCVVQLLLEFSAFAQEDDRQALIEKAQPVCLKWAKSTHYDMWLIRLDDLQRQLGLEDHQLAKAKIFAKSLSNKFGEKAAVSIPGFLNNVLNVNSDINAFVINGERIAFNEENNGEKELWIEVDGGKGWIYSRSRGSWMGEVPEYKFSDEGWDKAFKDVLTAKQLKDFDEEYEKYRSLQLAKGIVAAMDEKFYLTEDQMEPLAADIAISGVSFSNFPYIQAVQNWNSRYPLGRIRTEVLNENQSRILKRLIESKQ